MPAIIASCNHDMNEGMDADTQESEVGLTGSRRQFLRGTGVVLGATSTVWSFLLSNHSETTSNPGRHVGTDERRLLRLVGGKEDTFGASRSQAIGETTNLEEAPAEPFTRDRRLLLEGTPYETPLHVVDGRNEGPTAFLVGGMHGDEHAGHRAAEIVAEWGVERGTLVVLPAANRIALERGTRRGRHGDLNRQFPATGAREPRTSLAQAIWDAVVEYDPDWLADLHSSYGIYESGDGGVGQAIFPSSVAPARRYASITVQSVNRTFDLPGPLAYELGRPLSGDRPMLAHRAAKLLDIPTFILETTEEIELEHQVELHVFAIDSLLGLFNQDPVD